ncbi:formyltransferase family protein [Salinarimonas sp. NSM]|uniref:formyltransferase family protein n=1 Tax=Salinarimonas sp. NSM TaxID=3458003 RepID=UPI004036BC62
MPDARRKKIVAIVCRGLNGKILVGGLLARDPAAIDVLVEVPIVPRSPKTGRAMAGTSKRLKRAPLGYLLFQILVFHVSAALSMLAGRSVVRMARRAGIPVRRVSVSDEAFVAWLAQEAPDLVINASALILTAPIIAAARDGVLNSHAARLPEFRGPANAFWMLDEGVEEACGTVHLVDPGVDSGPIVALTPPRPVTRDTTVLELWTVLREDLAHSLSDRVAAYRAGTPLQATPQDESRAVQRSFPEGDVLRRIRARGHRIARLRDVWRIVVLSMSSGR